MKKKHPIIGLVMLVILGVIGGAVFRAGGAKAEITMNGVTYQMCAMTVRDFMEDGYVFSTMSAAGRFVYTYDYSNASLEAKTYYNSGVPLTVKDGYGAPINIWVYNPTAEEVEIREGKICSVSCEPRKLLDGGVTASIAGLELNDQTKAEITEYMGGALKGYQYSENEDVNAISYTKGNVSYTFRFDEDDVLEAGIARNEV